MKSASDIEIFVLAGGKSSRMGQDKGLMSFYGKPMIAYVLETVSSFNVPVTVIANSSSYMQLGYPVVQDVIKDKGPMGGLLTALRHTKKQFVFLIGCDMPFISKEVIATLFSGRETADVTAAATNNKLLPTCAVYKSTLKPLVEQTIINNELKLSDLIRSVSFKTINMDGLLARRPYLFSNLNSPAEIIKTREEWLVQE